jgi:integrase
VPYLHRRFKLQERRKRRAQRFQSKGLPIVSVGTIAHDRPPAQEAPVPTLIDQSPTLPITWEETDLAAALPVASATLAPQIVARTRQFLANDVSPNTARSIRWLLNYYQVWCAGNRVPGPWLPAHPEIFAGFLSDHSETHAYYTLDGWLNSIDHVHRRMNLPVLKDDFLVRRVMRGIAREIGTEQKQELPILRELLRQMLRKLRSRPLTMSRRRLEIILLVGWHVALRESELAKARFEDFIDVSGGRILWLQTSKTDQFGQGCPLPLVRGDDPELDPIAALDAWRAEYATTGPLLPRLHRSGKPAPTPKALCAPSVCVLIQELLVEIGLDATLYGSHSLRIGFITQAHRDGWPDADIALISRHADPQSLYHYIRRDADSLIAMLTALRGGS